MGDASPIAPPGNPTSSAPAIETVTTPRAEARASDFDRFGVGEHDDLRAGLGTRGARGARRRRAPRAPARPWRRCRCTDVRRRRRRWRARRRGLRSAACRRAPRNGGRKPGARTAPSRRPGRHPRAPRRVRVSDFAVGDVGDQRRDPTTSCMDVRVPGRHQTRTARRAARAADSASTVPRTRSDAATTTATGGPTSGRVASTRGDRRPSRRWPRPRTAAGEPEEHERGRGWAASKQVHEPRRYRCGCVAAVTPVTPSGRHERPAQSTGRSPPLRLRSTSGRVRTRNSSRLSRPTIDAVASRMRSPSAPASSSSVRPERQLDAHQFRFVRHAGRIRAPIKPRSARP